MLPYLEKHKTLAIILTILIAAEIFYFSSLSSVPGTPGKAINISVIYHFTVFFLFTIFLTTSIKNKKLPKKQIILILGISLIYAISDELHQLFVPGRFTSIKDIIVDLIGSIIAILIYPKKSQ